MSTQQVRVMVPPQVRAPRGVDWAVRIVVWLFRLGGRSLGATGRAA